MSDVAPADAPEETPAADTDTVPPAEDLKAEAEKWKATSRKHEDRAKANAAAAKELEALKLSSMDEKDKAVAEAVAAARAEVLREGTGRVVAAEVKAAATGTGLDVDALLEGLDTSRFITEDGDADTDAIAAWVERIAPVQETITPPDGMPDLGQGSRGKALPLNGDPLQRDLFAKLGIQG